MQVVTYKSQYHAFRELRENENGQKEEHKQP